MKRSPLLLAGGIAAVAASTAGCGSRPEAPRRPMNILYIMTDDHTSQMMSCYDDRYVSTPNLDRIADEGVRFTNSFVANSLSGPSRACMLTGKHSHANGYTDNTFCAPFDGSQQTFPKLLQGAGYETAVVGKWHLGSLPTGFDYWEVVPGQGDYYNPLFIRQSGDTTLCEGYLTNIITDKSIEWLEHGRDTTKPFCLLVHHKAQHPNWMADTCHLALYEERDFPLPETFFDDYEGRPAAAAQEMSIASDHDMDVVYDLKMWRKGVRSRLSAGYERMLDRMNPEQRAAWERFFRAAHRGVLPPRAAGARTGAVEVQPLHARLPEDAPLARRQRGAAARPSREVGSGRQHAGGLHLGPGLLHGRARLVRQALHV